MITFIITFIILMMLHELAHVLTAKAVNMKIDKIRSEERRVGKEC